jgi:hypothetical protein
MADNFLEDLRAAVDWLTKHGPVTPQTAEEATTFTHNGFSTTKGGR